MQEGEEFRERKGAKSKEAEECAPKTLQRLVQARHRGSSPLRTPGSELLR